MEQHNALFAASGSRHVAVGKIRYRIRYLPAFSDAYVPAFGLPFSVGGRKFFLDADQVPDAASLPVPAPWAQPGCGAAPARLPPDLLAAWIESCLEEFLDAAEAALGLPISPDLPGSGFEPRPGGSGLLHIRMEGGAGAGLRARLHFAREDLPAVSAWLGAPASAGPWTGGCAAGPLADDAALPIRIFFRLGGLRLRVGEYARLAPGDILLADGEERAESRVRITTGGRRPASCRAEWKEHELRVEERMSMESGAPEAASPALGWDDLDVEIAFDLGERVLSLREVRALQPGSVLTVPSNPDGKVRIRVNGRTVGSGSLLLVDGQMGVRILSLPENGPASGSAAGVP